MRRETLSRTPRSDHALGIALVVLSALAYSTAGLFAKGVEAGSWEIIFWRGLFAAGFSFVWTSARMAARGPNRRPAGGAGVARETFRMGRSGWAVAVVGALGTMAFIPAFKLTTIANVSLIYAVAPLIAALLAWLTMGERTSPRTLLGCLLALLGVGIIVWGSLGSINLQGDLLALCMTAAMATIMVIYRKVPETPAAVPTAMQSVLLLPVALLLGEPFAIAAWEIAILAAFGLLFAVAAIALAEGAKRVPSGQTALLSALETPLAIMLALLLLEEVAGAMTLVGGAIVLISIHVSSR